MKTPKRRKGNILTGFLMFLLFLFTGSCNDDKKAMENYDPSQPVEITEFTPQSGPARTHMFIYGNNFGTDLSSITVKIGGIKAKVIGSNGKCIYCVVPQRAFDGTVELTISPAGGTPVIVQATEKFAYERKTMVGTLFGQKSGTGEYTVSDGPFEKAGFKEITFLSPDPKNPNHLYAIENKASIRLIDLEKKEVSTHITNGQMSIGNPRSIAWTADENGMIISNDQNAEDGIANVLLRRQDNFLKAIPVVYWRSCLGSAVHPVNGEYYFSQWQGSIWKLDPSTGEPKQEAFNINIDGVIVYITFHPTGNYAYLTVSNRHAIIKSRYNWTEKILEVPQLFAGDYNAYGWNDGVGTIARFDTPVQGVFVKNEEYVRQEKEDIYDYYVCDSKTHSIRKITPEGMVTTFAGRGSSGLDGNHYGFVDGDLRKEARFNTPKAIAYDENTKTFYIADFENHRMRTIVVEDETTSTISSE